jgi:hypothetical protein
VLLCATGFAAGCGEDPYGPPGDDDDRPDADPNQPDADPTAPDARPDGGGPSTDGGDSAGPLIEVVSPTAGMMVRGTMTLIVRVTDPDAVDEDSVTASIGGVGEIAMGSTANDLWRGTYDTTDLDGLVFPTIVVRAADAIGNESQLGYQIVLDNQGPLSSLDPPLIRDAQRNDTGDLECSERYDPVGYDAPDDGESVAQLIELRARVQDVGNTGTTTSPVFIPRAGIDNTKVQLYVLDNTAVPLIVDTDGDGQCDAMNPEIVPSTVPMLPNEAAVIDLVAVEPAGEAYFGPDTFAGSNATDCVTGTAAEEPALLCVAGEPNTRIPAAADGVAMLYAPGPVSEQACVGFAFDALATTIADGWACAAVVATDLVGNVQVSPVLRFCVNSDGVGTECLPYTQIAPVGQRPNCTGTFTGGSTTTTPCTTPATFASSGVSGDYELIRIDAQ